MIQRLFVYLLLTVAAAAQQLPELAEVNRLAAEGRFKAAAQRAEQLIRQYPARWEPYHAAAQNWGRMRRYRKAQTHLEMARQINPDAAPVLFDLASTLYNQAKWDAALRYFRELEVLAGRNPEAQGRWQVPYFRGACAAKLEFVEEALEAYDRAIHMTTGDRQKDYDKELEIRNRMGGTALNSGRTRDALHHFTRLVEMQPTNAEFHYFLGIAHLNLGHLDKAEEALLQARRRKPDDFRIPLRLGKLYRRRNEILKAQSFFQLAADKNPQAYEPWYALRQIFTRTNDLDQADQAHKKYEELYAKSKEIEDKLREYRRRVKINPYDRDAYFEHGMLLIQHGRLPEGQERLQMLLAVDPQHELAIINVAQIIATRGDLQGAIFEMDKILERDPGHPIANLESARSLLRLGKIPQAYPRLVRCFERMDKDKTPDRYVTALRSWAALANQLRRPTDPLAEFEKALKHWSQNRDRLGELIEAYGALCAGARQEQKFYRAVQDVLPVLGKEHERFKPTIELVIRVAGRAGHTNIRDQYTATLRDLQ